MADITLESFDSKAVNESELEANRLDIKKADSNELEDNVLTSDVSKVESEYEKYLKGDEIKGDRAGKFDINPNGWADKMK